MAVDGMLRIALRVEEQLGTAVAEQAVDELEEAFERLAAYPRIGHRREDLTADERVLFWPVGPTLVAYRRSSVGVEILCVERGSLDWEVLFGHRNDS